MLSSLSIDYEIIDKTNHGKSISVAFKGRERDEQLEAINSLMPHTNGVLSATTAFGKTVTAAALIARRKINTLVLVHSKALLMQWHERLSEFLDIDFVEDNAPKKRGRKKIFLQSEVLIQSLIHCMELLMWLSCNHVLKMVKSSLL